ncbi:putative ribonuclease H-like domain-containing protein [Tanacetum coccineum]
MIPGSLSPTRNWENLHKLEIENQLDYKVKVIRCDNGTEFKNSVMNQVCEMTGIKRKFSVARTPQQNGVAERRNRTLIEATRTMLVDSKLPTTFWFEVVNTACYVLNRVLVIKPHNKIPYELIRGRTPLIDFMKYFGYPVTILNTRDHLGKFDGKADEGFFVGYSVVSKAMGVFNKRTEIVEETLNIRFLENTPNVMGNGPDWLFDVDSLTISMNYVPVVAGTQTIGPKDSEEDSRMKLTEADVNGDLHKDRKDDQATINITVHNVAVPGTKKPWGVLLLSQLKVERPLIPRCYEWRQDLSIGFLKLWFKTQRTSKQTSITSTHNGRPPANSTDTYLIHNTLDITRRNSAVLQSTRRADNKDALDRQNYNHHSLSSPSKQQALTSTMKEEKAKEKGVAQYKIQKQEEATNAALAEEFDEIQARIDADHELAQKEVQDSNKEQRVEKCRGNKEQTTYKNSSQKQDDYLPQTYGTKKRPRADSEEERSKKQQLEENNDAKKEELKDNGSSKNYKIFSEMLDDFDRQDLLDLHRLVNERYETTSPKGYDLLLWGDLKTLFKPNEEDEIWKNQQDYNLISWRLFDLCGVHVLLMNTGVAIHMMIEKKYPLT